MSGRFDFRVTELPPTKLYRLVSLVLSTVMMLWETKSAQKTFENIATYRYIHNKKNFFFSVFLSYLIVGPLYTAVFHGTVLQVSP